MHQTAQLLRKYYAGIGTPFAKVALSHLEKGEWRQLQELSHGRPESYDDADAFFKDVLVSEFFRKCELPGDHNFRLNNAKLAFWASEAQCKRTNLRLARYRGYTDLLGSTDVAVHDFICRWRKEVKRVLGKASYNLEPQFSGGSTLSDTGMQTTIPDKMSSVPTGYRLTEQLYREAFARTPQGEKYPNLSIVRSNRFFTVPKDSFKYRGCCVEASAAVSLQLAVGKAMKRLFRRAYRIDMRSLPLRHQRLARLASAGRRKLSTIDLSNASDTVARELVLLLLPDDWIVLLNSLRATHTAIDGKDVYLEKYSSMGNGFTFELETILFKTLCDTVCGERVCSAFGDDMIVPTDKAADIISALKFFGFSPNDKKTFCEGPFRESCGGDYFNGTPVRAHYVKQLPDEPQHWIELANGLLRADPNLVYFHAAWRFCQDQVPKGVRDCRGPKWLGDLVFHDESAEPTWRTYHTLTGGKRYENSPSHFYRVYRPVQRTFDLGKHFTYRVATAAATIGTASLVSPRDSISGYKLDWVAAYGVNDFYGWIDG